MAPRSSEGGAFQFSDLSPAGQRGVEANAREVGRGVKGKIKKRAAVIQSSIDTGVITNPDRVRKAQRDVGNLNKIAGKARNVDTSLNAAAARRAGYAVESIERSIREPGVGSGSGWYFEHAHDISKAARAHGIDPGTAVTASGVMSPQNSPANEKKAVTELMRERRGLETNPVNIRAGGTQKNINKARGVLSSSHEVTPGQAISPTSSPKVHSYTSSIHESISPPSSEPNRPHTSPVHSRAWSAQESEYRNRIGKVADVITGKVSSGQQQLDLHGLQEGRQKGVLDPKGNTAEDTWMNTITYGQSIENVGRTNVGKTIASDTMLGKVSGKTRGGKKLTSRGDVTPEGLTHAYNNEATIRAAEHLGQQFGVTNKAGESIFPAVATQEMAWTEIRRQSGKDPEYAAQRKAATAPPKKKPDTGTQLSLF